MSATPMTIINCLNLGLGGFPMRCERCGSTALGGPPDRCPYCPRKPVRIPGPEGQPYAQEKRDDT